MVVVEQLVFVLDKQPFAAYHIISLLVDQCGAIPAEQINA